MPLGKRRINLFAINTKISSNSNDLFGVKQGMGRQGVTFVQKSDNKAERERMAKERVAGG